MIKNTAPKITIVKNGTILPAKYFSGTYQWGLGGVLDAEDDFVAESGMEIPARFGGKYKYKISECEYISETVIFIGPLKTH